MMIEIDGETKDFVYLLRKVKKNMLEEFMNELKKEWEEYVDVDEKRNNEKGLELTIDSWMDIDEENEKVDRNNESNNESEQE